MASICRLRGWRDSPGRRHLVLRPVAIALGVLGVVEFAWGAGVLYTDRFILPRVFLTVAFIPAIGWGLILLAAVALENPALASPFPAFSMGVASFFNLVIAAVVALHLRRAAESNVRRTRESVNY